MVKIAVVHYNSEAQMKSRRKAAKMLIAVVLMFTICFLPVHLLNILRYSISLPMNDWTSAIAHISHWLCYANSAVNPIIYNFMSGKFRREFRNTFPCLYNSTKTSKHRSINSGYPNRSTHVENFNLNSFTNTN